jgi:flagellar motility protein MotE (MotC chaperone)
MTPKRSKIRFPVPRLLPVTMLAMAGLLVLKSGHLVQAATAAAAAAEPALAQSDPIAPQAKPAAEARVPVESPAPAPIVPAISDSERALLVDLRQRRLALDAREATLAARETTLAAVENRLDGRLAELTALQKRLEGLETARKQRDEANWTGLVKLYEVMKPRDAATIFNDLDLPVLLPVLDRMKEAKAAPILAAMVPERARQVTAELAQMRARANSVAQIPDLTGPGATKPAGG